MKRRGGFRRVFPAASPTTPLLHGIDPSARVLAIDAASSSGTAWDGLAGCTPSSRTYALGGVYGPRDLGQRCREFVSWLGILLNEVRPSVIGLEAPLTIRAERAQQNELTTRYLVSLAAMVHLCGASRDIPVIEREAQAIKVYLTGDRLATKDAMMKMCNLFGWRPANYDEADAMGLWALIKSEIDPKFSIATTPLFGRQQVRG